MSGTAHRIAVPPVLDAAAARTLRGAIEATPAGAVAVLVASGAADGVFCTGLDLASAAAADAAAIDAGLSAYADLLLALRGLPRPVIAVLDGAVLGGGLGLAAAADVVLAGEGARFGLPECLYGLSPAIALAAILERVSVQGARRLALAAETIGPAEAAALGLVDRALGSAELDAALAREVRRLSRGAAGGIAAVRRHPPALRRFAADIAEGVEVTRARLADPEVRARIGAAQFQLAGSEP
jgi:methylglutaconyl-CoA hydratase